MGFFHTKKSLPEDYDRDSLVPVIRVSICTGEEVAGFQNRMTGKFTEVQLLRSASDLKAFMDRYGISEIPQRIY